MKLYDLKKAYPTMPSDIRSMVSGEVKKQLEKEELKERSRRSLLKAAAIIAAAVMVLGLSAFTFSRIFGLRTERQGEHGLKLSITAESGIPSELPILTVQPGWLPEGFVPETYGYEYAPMKFWSADTPWQGGLSVAFYAIDESTDLGELPLMERYVLESEELTIGSRDAVYVRSDLPLTSRIVIDKRIYIVLPEYWQVMVIFAGQDVSRDEALRFAEGLSIEDTGELNDHALTLSSFAEQAGQEIYTPVSTASEAQMENTHRVGDSFSIIDPYDEGLFDGITVRVSDVRFADDLSLLDDRFVDDDVTSLLGENGRLRNNTVSYIKAGDGVTGLDEIIYSEEIGTRLVYATLEYTNNGTADVYDLIYNASFVFIEKDGEDHRVFEPQRDRALRDGDERTDCARYSSAIVDSFLPYLDVLGEDGKNYIPRIGAGETVVVHAAVVVSADLTDMLYLNLTPFGGANLFSEAALLTGYVDLNE